MDAYACAFCDTYGVLDSNSAMLDYDKEFVPRNLSMVTKMPLPSPPRDDVSGCFNYKMQNCRQESMQTPMCTFPNASQTQANKCIKHMPMISDASNICYTSSQIKPNVLDSYNMLYTNTGHDIYPYSASSASQPEANQPVPVSDTFEYLHCLPTPTTLGPASWAYQDYPYDKSPVCSEFPMQQIMFPDYPGLLHNYNDSNMMDCSTLANKDYGYMTYKVPAPNLYTPDLIRAYDDASVSSGVYNMTQSCNTSPSFHVQTGMYGSTQYSPTLNASMDMSHMSDLQYDHSLHPQYKEHNSEICFNGMVDGNYAPELHHNMNNQRTKCFKIPNNNILIHSIKKPNDSLAVRRGKPIASLIKSYIPLSEAVLKEIVDSYFSLSPSESYKQKYTITIYTSKVAQKSYGTEKRYLCPPPYVRLIGSRWFENCSHDLHITDPIFIRNQKETSYETNISIMDTSMDIFVTSLLLDVEESFSMSSMDCYCTDGSIFRPGSSKMMPIWGKTNLRAMYIPDRKDKIRSTCLKVQLHKKNKELFNFAQFQSSPICIISKASQKKTSSKNNDMLIYHGSTIALFNRSKAQTNRIRFLGSSSANAVITNSVLLGIRNHYETEINPENAFLSANSQSWEPFQIWSLDSFINPTSPRDMDQNVNLIRFNQVVVLQCSTTGLITTPLIIRRVDGRNTVLKTQESLRSNEYKNVLDNNEPVNSLQKIAFQIYTHDSDNSSDIYLTYQDESIVMQPARLLEKDEPNTGVPDFESSSKMSNQNPLWDMSNSNSTIDTMFPQKDVFSNSYNRLFTYHDFMQKFSYLRADNLSNDVTHDSQNKTKSLYMKSMSFQNVPVDKTGQNSIEETFEVSENVMESAVWNIVGISSVESSFYVSPQSKVNTIGFVPIIKEIKYLSVNIIQIIGQNITQSYSVWIDGKPCKIFRFSTSFADDNTTYIDLQCILHPQILPHDSNYILLVRDDGVIFDLGKRL